MLHKISKVKKFHNKRLKTNAHVLIDRKLKYSVY